MFFLVIGIFALIAGFAINTPALTLSRYARPVKLVSVVLIVLGLLSSNVRQIDAGSVGVQNLFGQVQDHVLESGLNFVNPLVNVTEYDVKTRNYTMSAIADEGNKDGDDAIRVLSADGLQVVIDLTVLYKVVPSEAAKIHSEIGPDYIDKIVRPVTRTRIRDNAVYYLSAPILFNHSLHASGQLATEPLLVAFMAKPCPPVG